MIALAPFIGWVALPVAAVFTAALGAIGKAIIGSHKAKLEETLEQAELDRRLRIPIMGASAVDPREIGVDPASQNVLPGGEVPDYLPRDKDREIRDALEAAFKGEGRWIVAVCGSSKAGKSRALFEALRWYDEEGHDLRLIAPKNGEGVRSLLEPDQLPAELAGSDLVVWLDDLETFVADGVNLDVLREWHDRAGVVFAATYGGKGSERLGEASSGGLTVLTDTLLQHATQIGIGKTHTTELERLPADLSPLLRQEIARHGLPAVLVSGPALERKLVTGRHAPGEPESQSGVAVVRAAVDWARCGRTDPISTDRLRELWETYLPAGTQPSDDGFKAGLEWALRPVSGTIALLHRVASFLPYDYIVNFVEDEGGDRPSDAAWACALSDSDPGQAFSVGVRAVLNNRQDDALTAMTTASEAPDPELSAVASFNVGVILKERNQPERAREMFKKADEFGLGEGASNHGFLLQEKGDLEGAEGAFRRAAERGNANGAFNLGLLREEKGDLEGAVRAYQRADELGEADGSINLGVLLEDQGDLEGAEGAYRRAAERDSPAGTFNLGLLLEERGELEGAEEAFRRADALEEGAATSKLGLILEGRGDLEGAEEAYRRAAERDSPAGTFNLGLLLEKQGDVEGAEDAFRRADALGHPKSTLKLGLVLREKDDLEGAEEAFRRAAERGLGGGYLALAAVLAHKGDLGGAQDNLQRAAASEDPEVVEVATTALKQLPEPPAS